MMKPYSECAAPASASATSRALGSRGGVADSQESSLTQLQNEKIRRLVWSLLPAFMKNRSAHEDDAVAHSTSLGDDELPGASAGGGRRKRVIRQLLDDSRRMQMEREDAELWEALEADNPFLAQHLQDSANRDDAGGHTHGGSSSSSVTKSELRKKAAFGVPAPGEHKWYCMDLQRKSQQFRERCARLQPTSTPAGVASGVDAPPSREQSSVTSKILPSASQQPGVSQIAHPGLSNSSDIAFRGVPSGVSQAGKRSRVNGLPVVIVDDDIPAVISEPGTPVAEQAQKGVSFVLSLSTDAERPAMSAPTLGVPAERAPPPQAQLPSALFAPVPQNFLSVPGTVSSAGGISAGGAHPQVALTPRGVSRIRKTGRTYSPLPEDYATRQEYEASREYEERLAADILFSVDGSRFLEPVSAVPDGEAILQDVAAKPVAPTLERLMRRQSIDERTAERRVAEELLAAVGTEASSRRGGAAADGQARPTHALSSPLPKRPGDATSPTSANTRAGPLRSQHGSPTRRQKIAEDRELELYQKITSSKAPFIAVSDAAGDGSASGNAAAVTTYLERDELLAATSSSMNGASPLLSNHSFSSMFTPASDGQRVSPQKARRLSAVVLQESTGALGSSSLSPPLHTPARSRRWSHRRDNDDERSKQRKRFTTADRCGMQPLDVISSSGSNAGGGAAANSSGDDVFSDDGAPPSYSYASKRRRKSTIRVIDLARDALNQYEKKELSKGSRLVCFPFHLSAAQELRPPRGDESPLPPDVSTVVAQHDVHTSAVTFDTGTSTPESRVVPAEHQHQVVVTAPNPSSGRTGQRDDDFTVQRPPSGQSSTSRLVSRGPPTIPLGAPPPPSSMTPRTRSLAMPLCSTATVHSPPSTGLPATSISRPSSSQSKTPFSARSKRTTCVRCRTLASAEGLGVSAQSAMLDASLGVSIVDLYGRPVSMETFRPPTELSLRTCILDATPQVAARDRVALALQRLTPQAIPQPHAVETLRSDSPPYQGAQTRPGSSASTTAARSHHLASRAEALGGSAMVRRWMQFQTVPPEVRVNTALPIVVMSRPQTADVTATANRGASANHALSAVRQIRKKQADEDKLRRKAVQTMFCRQRPSSGGGGQSTK